MAKKTIDELRGLIEQTAITPIQVMGGTADTATIAGDIDPENTKAEVSYVEIAESAERCKGCKHFLPPSGCSEVIGQISPHGWCELFDYGAGRDQDVIAPFRQYREGEEKDEDKKLTEAVGLDRAPDVVAQEIRDLLDRNLKHFEDGWDVHHVRALIALYYDPKGDPMIKKAIRDIKKSMAGYAMSY